MQSPCKEVRRDSAHIKVLLILTNFGNGIESSTRLDLLEYLCELI